MFQSFFNGQMSVDTLQIDAFTGFVREVSAATYTATLSDFQILLTDTCAVTLPTLAAAYDSLAAVTGYGAIIMIKVENIGDCTVDANGAEYIDSSNSAVSLSAWDNIVVMATHARWIIQ